MARWLGGSRRKTPEEYEAEATRLANGCLEHPTAVARRVHRARHGRALQGLQVCHTCDNPRCIEDAHHWLGTGKQNIEDRDRKGRWRGGRPIKLTAKDKEAILKAPKYYAPESFLKKKYGVCEPTIRKIRNGKHTGALPAMGS